jgi:Zn finger protein HypA/HybF involved in hydrogenase expression
MNIGALSMSIVHYKCRYHGDRLLTDYNDVKYCPKCRATKNQLTTTVALKIYNELEENSRETINSLNAR